jgi:formylglycine-generating enzyme required for sulfatase activity
VSDDSLVQCIRELRDKLGDREHQLIKTAPRRGYLLDAIVATLTDTGVAVVGTADGLAAPLAEATPTTAPTPGMRLARIAAAGLLCVAVAALTYMLVRSPEPAPVATPGSLADSTPTAEPTRPRPVFQDCNVCPEMVALPAGEFLMGSPKDEPGHLPVEGLPRRVVIAGPIAIGKFEVTVDQFSAFIADTGTSVSNQCRLIRPESHTPTWGPPEASFREPGYGVTGSHPVSCVSWHDAEAYVAWLRRRTGKPYRLPTEAEWEYAVRAGTTTSFSFGDDATQLCAHAKFADLASPFGWRGTCRSEAAAYGPLPVGSLKPNPWGLFDTHGNLWEWVEDCWTADPLEIPTDGSALARPRQCEMGVVRGGSFAAARNRMRSAFRLGILATRRDHNLGFRVALPLKP